MAQNKNACSKLFLYLLRLSIQNILQKSRGVKSDGKCLYVMANRHGHINLSSVHLLNSVLYYFSLFVFHLNKSITRK
jgi:hypothetical protein